MSWPGWALPTFAAAIVGLGLFSTASHFDGPHFDADTRSASRPVVPVLSSPDNEGPSPTQQPSETPTPTSSPEGAGLAPSKGAIMAADPLADPLASEAMEAASREPVAAGSAPGAAIGR